MHFSSEEYAVQFGKVLVFAIQLSASAASFVVESHCKHFCSVFRRQLGIVRDKQSRVAADVSGFRYFMFAQLRHVLELF